MIAFIKENIANRTKPIIIGGSNIIPITIAIIKIKNALGKSRPKNKAPSNAFSIITSPSFSLIINIPCHYYRYYSD